VNAAALDTTLAALADPTRRRTIELLRERPRRPGELAGILGVSPPVVSRHLRVLRTRGLVQEEAGDPADSRLRLYRLRREPFEELSAWLAKVEAFWADQLGSFKAHAESTRKGRRS